MSPTAPTDHPGDDGRSDLLSGSRAPKDAPVFECLGMLDELNAALGSLRVSVRRRAATQTGAPHSAAAPATDRRPEASAPTGGFSGPDADLRAVQIVLGRIMAVVAGFSGEPSAGDAPAFDADIAQIERSGSRLRGATEIGGKFYIPGDGTEASARADIARACCRTAERTVLTFSRAHGLPAPDDMTEAPESSGRGSAENATEVTSARRYLNRLSDYLFVLARHLDE